MRLWLAALWGWWRDRRAARRRNRVIAFGEIRSRRESPAYAELLRRLAAEKAAAKKGGSPR